MNSHTSIRSLESEKRRDILQLTSRLKIVVEVIASRRRSKGATVIFQIDVATAG